MRRSYLRAAVSWSDRMHAKRSYAPRPRRQLQTSLILTYRANKIVRKTVKNKRYMFENVYPKYRVRALNHEQLLQYSFNIFVQTSYEN